MRPPPPPGIVPRVSDADAKHRLREEIRGRLRMVTPQQRAAWSAAAAERVLAMPEVREARTVCLFASLPSEIDTDGLFTSLRSRGCVVAAPRMVAGTHRLDCYGVERQTDLRMNKLGLREPEPDPSRRVAAELMDVVIVPGLGFDRHGNRLGRGKGYYDGFLKAAGPRPLRIGLYYALQELDAVPRHPWDEPVAIVVTEGEVIRAG